MALKIFRVLWFLSFMALFASLMYNYAGWQEELIVQNDSSASLSMSRVVVFYVVLCVFGLINVFVYLFG